MWKINKCTQTAKEKVSVGGEGDEKPWSIKPKESWQTFTKRINEYKFVFKDEMEWGWLEKKKFLELSGLWEIKVHWFLHSSFCWSLAEGTGVGVKCVRKVTLFPVRRKGNLIVVVLFCHKTGLWFLWSEKNPYMFVIGLTLWVDVSALWVLNPHISFYKVLSPVSGIFPSVSSYWNCYCYCC